MVLLGLVGFFARQWFLAQAEAQKEREKAQAERDTAMQTAMSGLTTSISELNKTLTSIDKAAALTAQKVDNHADQLQELWGKACQNPACPYRLGAKA